MGAGLTLWCALCGAAADAVSLSDLDRFPGIDVIETQRAANRHALAVCRFEASWSSRHAEVWWEIGCDLRRRDDLWDKLRDARDESYSPDWRMTLLRQLREAIGRPGYDAGAMPPAVPPQWAPLFR